MKRNADKKIKPNLQIVTVSCLKSQVWNFRGGCIGQRDGHLQPLDGLDEVVLLLGLVGDVQTVKPTHGVRSVMSSIEMFPMD